MDSFILDTQNGWILFHESGRQEKRLKIKEGCNVDWEDRALWKKYKVRGTKYYDLRLDD